MLAVFNMLQVARAGNLCYLKAEICPEHRVSSNTYSITATINERAMTIVDVSCLGCLASESSYCKHSIALFWLDRRNQEKSTTELKCYWNKPPLLSALRHYKYSRIMQLKRFQLRRRVSLFYKYM